MEYEYGIIPPKPNQYTTITRDIFSDDKFSIIKVDGRNHWRNGAQVYLDDTTLEVALPECRGARAVVAYDEATSLMLYLLGTERNTHIFKNNIEVRGNSFGCHENYFVSRRPLELRLGPTTYEKLLNYIAHNIIPFLVTRQIFTGSGFVKSPEEYLMSQRTTVINNLISHGTLGEARAIFHIRHEPLSADGLRIHLILGDSNMSEFTTYLKLGTTAIVLRMIEAGYLREKFYLKDPVAALHTINECGPKTGIPLDKKYDSHSHERSIRATDIQRWYLEKARAFFDDNKDLYGSEVEDILKKWEFVLERMERDLMSLDQYIDWVIKRSLIDACARRKGRKLNLQEMKQIDLQYHLLHPSDGLYFCVRDDKKLARVCSEDEIKRAVKEPPQDTRAFGRTRLIKEIEKKGWTITHAHWQSIEYMVDTCQTTIELPDPFETYTNREL